MMITLFDQEFEMKAYAKSYAEDVATERAIRTAVEMCQSFGSTVEDTIRRIAEKFNLSQEKASEYVKEYWSVSSNTSSIDSPRETDSIRVI